MKVLITLLVFIILLSGCQSDKNIAPVNLSGCSNPIYTRVKELKDVRTVIIAKTYTAITGSNFTTYFIDHPDTGFNVPWLACNLPEQYKKDNLTVRISGYTLTYPGIEKSNDNGNPIELTRIEVDNSSR